jgi:hypothetical protein
MSCILYIYCDYNKYIECNLCLKFLMGCYIIYIGNPTKLAPIPKPAPVLAETAMDGR